jgi:uncharacterized membrane protein YkoI
MNIRKLHRKRVVLPTVATVAVLGIGGTMWTAAANDDVQGGERDRVGAAAVEAAGGGTVVDVEASDDRGEAYEVEVRMDDGTEVDVTLDQDLNPVSQDADDRDDRDRDDNDADGDDGLDADDRAVSAEERQSAEQAALDAVGGGTVEQVEASDDSREAYEVEVRMDDGTEWDVELDADYDVLSKTTDD